MKPYLFIRDYMSSNRQLYNYPVTRYFFVLIFQTLLQTASSGSVILPWCFSFKQYFRYLTKKNPGEESLFYKETFVYSKDKQMCERVNIPEITEI